MQNQHGGDILDTNSSLPEAALLRLAWMCDVWFDSSNKDMDEQMDAAGGCN